jgi:hypothetical protein
MVNNAAGPALITPGELARLCAAEAKFVRTRENMVESYRLHKEADVWLGRLTLSFLTKVLAVDEQMIPEIMKLHVIELQDLLVRRYNSGVFQIADGAPAFRLAKEEGTARVQVVVIDPKTALPDLSEWWTQNPR